MAREKREVIKTNKNRKDKMNLKIETKSLFSRVKVILMSTLYASVIKLILS